MQAPLTLILKIKKKNDNQNPKFVDKFLQTNIVL